MNITHQCDADAIVVGGGPAGCTAARILADHGLKTILLESRRYPRRKTCAGVLSVKALPLLPPGSEAVLGRPLYGVEFRFANERAVRYRRETPYARMVDRSHFDSFLACKATEAGAIILEGLPVLGVEAGKGAFAVVTEKGKYFAPVIVGADGANSVVRKSLGLGRVRSGFGVEAHLPPAGRAEVDGEEAVIDYGAIPWGYGWVFPREDGYSVGVGSFARLKDSIKGYFESYLRYVTDYEINRLDVRLHPIPLGGESVPALPTGCVLAGDAAGFVDPFYGEGIYYAILGGLIAADCIARDKAEKYPSMVKNRIVGEMRRARTLARIFYRAPRFFHDRLVRKRRVIEAFLKTVAGESSYRALGRWLLTHGVTELIRTGDER